MRTILHLMGMDSTKYGGIEHFNVALATKLKGLGYKSVFIYESQPENQDFVYDITAAGAGLTICNSRHNKLRFCVQFARLLWRYRPCLLHAHFTKARFYAIPIARLMGVKNIFFTVHGEMGSRESIKPHTRLWYAYANRIARVITVSEKIKTQYLALWPSARVTRQYLGVLPVQGKREEARRSLGIAENGKMVLCVANFNHIKGLDILSEAIHILASERVLPQGTHFYIVGQPDEDRKALNETLQQLGIAGLVHTEGISNQVGQYMAAADIYVQPSRSEGLPLALMEAASAGLPLIGTNVGGIPEVVRDTQNGILVESENAAQLADAISNLLQDDNLRIRYGKNSYSVYRECFSIDSATDHLIELYHLPSKL